MSEVWITRLDVSSKCSMVHGLNVIRVSMIVDIIGCGAAKQTRQSVYDDPAGDEGVWSWQSGSWRAD